METPGLIRRLWAFERDRVRDHLLRLHPADRRLRFAGPTSEARLQAYCDDLDWNRAFAIGHLVAGEVRGLGELKPSPSGHWPRTAEAALSVERPFQNRGIGTAILQRLMVMARNRLITSINMIALAENGAILQVARKLDARLEFEQGEVSAHLALPWPNQLTLLLELFASLRSPASWPVSRQFTGHWICARAGLMAR